MTRRYGMWEIAVSGRADGNPFLDYQVFADIAGENEQKTVKGFYDGDGTYRVRFMPSFTGEYSYRIYGSFCWTEYTGTFTVEEADSHGMVCAEGVTLRYADGTLYNSIGTTCYVWNLQKEEIQKNTLKTLKDSAFNKIRFCLFPKHYDYNFRNPVLFPFEGTPVDNSGINKQNFNEYKAETEGSSWDFEHLNLAYFKMLDGQIQALEDLGIEADIILFHPYDRWGFAKMTMEQNEFYLRYVLARYSAYRNVWWSLANEYDLCTYKTIEDWEQIAAWIVEDDPYGHLRSIHNCRKLYDFTKDWVTHCSIQRQRGNLELDFIPEWLEQYKKPVVIDEMCYEGNIEQDWGNISPEEMLRRMWKTVVNGGYPGHGECYDLENVWWSHGGVLHGESHKRFGLLLDMMNEANGKLLPYRYTGAATEDERYILHYYGEHRPDCKRYKFPGKTYRIEVIDTWEMTVKQAGTFTDSCCVELPGKEYMALRMMQVD